jgi:diguanylate cyclase (GGDEF)-like protein
MSQLKLNLLTALAYAATGWLSLQLAIEPGYVSLVYVPAGVAMAAVVMFGAWALPGIFLGSLAVHWLAALQSGGTGWWSWVLMTGAVGAALQALAGARLARRWAHYPGPVDSPASVTWLMLGVVPLSCMINASLSVPVLVASGIVPPSEALFTWWTWWLGDALGAGMTLPVALVLLGQPAELWRPRRLALVVPMGLAALLVGSGILLVNKWERQALEREFSSQTSALATQLQRRLDAQSDSVLAVSRLFVLNEHINRSDFQASVEPWLSHYAGTQNFGWSPHITDVQRPAFEAQMRERGETGYEIRGRTPDGATYRAEARPDYLPIAMVAPRSTNLNVIGLDVQVLDATAHAIQGARETRQPRVTQGMRLVQESGEQRGVVLYQAVFESRPPSQFKGVVSAVFRVDDVLSSALESSQRRRLQLCLVDPEATPGNQRLAGPVGCELANWLGRGLQARLPLAFGQSVWSMRIKADDSFATAERSWSTWTMVATALISVGLLGAFLLVVTGQNRRTQSMVDLRTAELAHSNAGLQQLAHFDLLTGLPNRSFWMNQARTTLESVHRHQDTMAVIFLDLDHFKHINDTLGHAVGDQLLQVVAQRLLSCLRAEDVLARLGGDEFVALLPRLRSLDDAVPVAEKFLRVLSEPLSLEGRDLTLTVSVGIAGSPPDSADIDTLLRHADTAMYAAKDSGRNAWRVFAPEMHQRVSQRMFIQNGLRRALQQGDLFLEYQPQIDGRSARVVGVEALLRWQHPEQGLIGPLEFIGVAEESGLIEAIGRWVLFEACRQMSAWDRDGLGHLQMAVNISALQFRKPDFVTTVRDALASADLAPARLELEITESLLMQPLHELNERLHELTAMGLTLALDDFGTGYSSLGYLKRLPLSRLKLDRSFVSDLPGNLEDEAITRATLSIARDLGLNVVAEGVETEAQRDFLLVHGCTIMQGWLYARAMPGDAFAAWLDDYQSKIV